MVLRIPKLFRLLEKPAGKNGERNNHANNHNNSSSNHSSASDKDEKKNEKSDKEEKKDAEKKEERKEEKKEVEKTEKKEEKKNEIAAPPWVARTELAPVPKKIKFLFVSIEALIGDMAWIIKKEGHDVRYAISDKDCKDICDGFVDKTDDWKKDAVEWADVIVFDDVGFGSEADALRKKGKLVIGGTAYTDKLEDSREFGQDELSAVGVNVLPHWDFDDFDSAVKFIEQNPGRYVMKPSGDAQNEKELLFIAQEEDSKDLLNVLAHYKKAWAKKIKKFQIQKYAAGVEVAVGAFFNGRDFIYPVNINFEHKKLFPGEIGPSTGEMGTLCFWSQPNELFKQTLEKMKARLAQSGYCGYIDINCIANARGIFPLEFTSRFGYPTLSLFAEGATMPWGDFFYRLARGEKPELKTKKGFQVCVVVAVPPFPFEDLSTFKKYSEDATVLFKKQDSLEGVHLGDVKLVEDDWRIAGVIGYALVITGSGATVEEACKQAYKRVENVMIPNMFYRTDIGLRWSRDSDRLQTWGYLY